MPTWHGFGPRWPKKRLKRESETEYNTSKVSGTREEKSRRKMKKKTKEKLQHAGKKEEKKGTDQQQRREKWKEKKNTWETVSKLLIQIIFSLLS